MKAFFLSITFLVLISCNLLDNGRDITCPKLNPEGDNLFWGEANAKWNGEPWPQQPSDMKLYAVSNQREDLLSIHIDAVKLEEPYEEQLYFGAIPNTIATHSLPQIIPQRGEPQRSFFFTVIGGDVLGDPYRLLTDSMNNQITIDSFDRSECVVEGRFELAVARDTALISIPSYPDTIRFTDGFFRTHVVMFD